MAVVSGKTIYERDLTDSDSAVRKEAHDLLESLDELGGNAASMGGAHA
jgi:hypothetical protein